MRTNIDIDDQLMSDVLAAGPYKTKKEAVEAGLLLLKRQAAARELLKLRGQLRWGWDEQEERLNGKPNWSGSEPVAMRAAEPAPPPYKVASIANKATSKAASKAADKATSAAVKTKGKSRARR